MMTTTPRFKHYSNAITYKIEAKEHDYLYVEQSQIPGSGNGLFTAIPIYQDEVISVFKGEVLSAREAHSRALNNEDGCFVNLPDGTLMDSMQVNCFAKYANDAAGFARTHHKNNARITLDEGGTVCIVASRNIAAGKEIFCSYGKKYWQNTIEKGKDIERADTVRSSQGCSQSPGA